MLVVAGSRMLRLRARVNSRGRMTADRLPLAALPAVIVVLAPHAATAYDFNDQLSVGVVGTAVAQYGDFDAAGVDDQLKGATVAQLTASYRPTGRDEFNLVVSFAADNALNDVSPLSLTPFAGNLADALKDINYRNRDYLLTLWYKHRFELGDHLDLSVTGGLIDSTDYLDTNLYANDEVEQFMNEVFVNNPVANLPSNDIGLATTLEMFDNWTFDLVWMNSETENPNPHGGFSDQVFNYFGAQLGYRLKSALGSGNYRLLVYTTDDGFAAATGDGLEALRGVGVSLDQQLSDTLGLFARFGWQDDQAAVDHDGLASIGVNLSGALWRRSQDQIGLGLAYLRGADHSGLDWTNALEGYVKFGLTAWANLSFDLQAMRDQMDAGPDPAALIYGTRFNLSF
jgi:porin